MKRFAYPLRVLVHHLFSKAKRFFVVLFVMLFLGGGICGCSDKEKSRIHEPTLRSRGETAGVLSDVALSHAKGFTLHNHDGFKTLAVTVDLDSRSDTLRYLLLPGNASVPDGFDDYLTIRTPVERIALFSTTHIGYIDLLGCADRIIAVARPEYVNNQSLQERIRNGDISEIGMPFSPNVEVILELDPDVIVATALPASRKTDYQALVSAGIPVVVVAEWLEQSPLGRAEWMKLYGALLGRENLAREKFAAIERSYTALASTTDTITRRPSIVPGMPFKDAWFVPGGKSYVAQLLRDAGAEYYWSGTAKAGSIKMDIEAVYPVALDAEFWLNPGTVLSLEELQAKDARFRDFSSVKSGKVYNNNKQLNPAGGNAYWELGVVQPDRILEDLIRILHPDIFSGGSLEDSLTFYRHIR